jgi:hypothetical protein
MVRQQFQLEEEKRREEEGNDDAREENKICEKETPSYLMGNISNHH